MGLVPLSFQEIGAYITYAGIDLTPQEVTLIRELSEIYCSYTNNKNPKVKSPFKKN